MIYLNKFSFNKEQLSTFKDKSGSWVYEAPFNLNQADVTGQTLLYLACCVSSVKIVDLLMSYRVKAKKVERSKGASKDDFGEEVLQPMKSRQQQAKKSRSVSGIQALISKLRGSGEDSSASADQSTLAEDEIWLNPLQLDVYCNSGTETALHHAVKKREHAIATKLLTAGSDPNLVIYAAETSPQPFDEQFYFRGSTCLVEACKNRDMGMIDLLLKYGARDDECKALYVAALVKEDGVVSKLLSLKANQERNKHFYNRREQQYCLRGSQKEY